MAILGLSLLDLQTCVVHEVHLYLPVPCTSVVAGMVALGNGELGQHHLVVRQSRTFILWGCPLGPFKFLK